MHIVKDVKSEIKRGKPVGGQAWNKGLTKSDHPSLARAGVKGAALRLGKKIVQNWSDESRMRVSIHQSNKNNGGRCKWFQVDNVLVQGQWEYNFALKMNELGIKWEKVKGNPWKYVMNGKTRHYTPDFFLEDSNIFIELKGYWWGDDKRKMEHVMSQHTDKRIIIIQRDDYLKVLDGELVW